MVDTHSHLTDEPLAGALDAVLRRAAEAGVTQCIVPGYDPASWAAGRALAATHDGVRFAAGIHPLFADEAALPALEAELAKGGMVALGELGLDFVDEKADRALQLRVFRHQLRLARDAHVPVIIHCRHAHDDLLAELRACPGIAGVLHSCSCSQEQIKPFIDLGLYVGFSGVVTRDGPRKVKKLAVAVPRDRILAETDSPFIGTARHPVPQSEPADVADVVAALAALGGCTEQDMARLTTGNACHLFRLAVPGRVICT